MDLENIKSSIVINVYHVPADKDVALHNHLKYDEVFYCIKGEGYGILDDGEIELSVGKTFIVPAGMLHTLRSDSDLYVTSFLIPAIE